ncbi:hypothetical protein DSM104299_01676 [Baekduia alba]|uniref:hypothetical protein n=1 Tax=Baekduia alba TaxID=2997333 RepID=UPI0023424F40|nr:hypothetical protein [Baekduia alba]WCB92975.1 hypothetical protein DSM104299_01676 [Baekduia alba]
MAKTTDSGDCGCGSAGQRHEQRLAGEILGDRWKGIVEEILMKEGAERARAFLGSQQERVEGDIEVRTSMTIYVTFARDGEDIDDKGLVSCVCTNDGTVCVCRGACDFDACCDVDGGAGPIVAKA